MSESVEGGAALAWRLLATLEGGSLLLVTSALLAYTARNRVFTQQRDRQIINQVLVTNTRNILGRELKRQLESHGCVVSTLTDGALGGTSSGILSEDVTMVVPESSKVDALVIVGADSKSDDLNELADLVSQNVYENLKLLESLSSLVRRGGSLSWACTGTSDGVFSGASSAFDTVLRASLQHIARNSHCEAIWVGRCAEAERAAERTVAALLHCDHTFRETSFSLRNPVQKIKEYFGRWLKNIA